MLATKEDWRSIIAQLYDEEEEYTWTDQRESEAIPPWTEGQQINVNLKPWTKENSKPR
jgi:hypothetical protein